MRTVRYGYLGYIWEPGLGISGILALSEQASGIGGVQYLRSVPHEVGYPIHPLVFGLRICLHLNIIK